ncbi:MAG TPA: acetyl-CoA carboxylase biotin carboxyl carrier protein [Pontiellaceae bacterium]|nr:acetyl-CoA carboxylase biotin carboxyl carrier protein [Pontiellaceae bacterium]HPR83034.1 acetyl-CoA carboxylase biotin carboxyl carrier protein [Pontiellaceae bacterium]
MELKEIKKIVEMMTENDLAEFLLEEEAFTLQLKRGTAGITQIVSAPQQMMAAPAVAAPVAGVPAAVAPVAAAPVAANDDAGLVAIKSPMVGTFYRSPSPDSDVFVQIGQDVTPDSVVCIIEAMKVMNEIQAEVKGKIKKILVDNATPVQFGQPLFLVEPA